MPLVYATAEDLAEEPWSLDPVPANAARLIAKASLLVRTAVRSALYDVDSAGKPSDEDVLAGFRDAVCAQVAAWVEAGIDPTTEGTSTSSGIVASKSLGPRSVSYAGANEAVSARQRMVSGLTAEAMGYLRDLNIWFGVQVYG